MKISSWIFAVVYVGTSAWTFSVTQISPIFPVKTKKGVNLLEIVILCCLASFFELHCCSNKHMTALLEYLEALHHSYSNYISPPDNLLHRGWSPPCHPSSPPLLWSTMQNATTPVEHHAKWTGQEKVQKSKVVTKKWLRWYEN